MTTSRFSQESLDQFGECWRVLKILGRATQGCTISTNCWRLRFVVLCGGQGPTDMALLRARRSLSCAAFSLWPTACPATTRSIDCFAILTQTSSDSFQRFMAQFSEQLQGGGYRRQGAASFV